MFTVLVRGLEFYGFHGVPDAEQVVGHRYIVDVELEVDGAAELTDDVADTVDYGQVAHGLSLLGVNSQFRTVERLARAMADHLLEAYPRVVELEIEVRKLLPPAPVILEEAGVRLTVRR
jgi:dihydroneopterin aldolase